MQIVKIRQENKVSQKQIGELTGISQANIARLNRLVRKAMKSP